MSYILAKIGAFESLAFSLLLFAETAFAQGTSKVIDSTPRRTLFHWSYGSGSSGGVDRSEPIMTDRPDFTEASSTVGRRVLQIESGYTHTFDNDGTTKSIGHNYPESLFRYGVLADWLEFRVATNFAHQQIDSIAESGFSDLYLGLKIGLTPQESILPEMALVPQMNIPLGADEFSSDEVLPGLNWLYGWDVNDFISTAGSTQFNRDLDDQTNASYTKWAQSWTVGYSLAENVGAYTEWFAIFPSSADTEKPQHYFDGGVTYRFTNDIQWDVRGGVGLNEAADDYFVGSGLSIRLW